MQILEYVGLGLMLVGFVWLLVYVRRHRDRFDQRLRPDVEIDLGLIQISFDAPSHHDHGHHHHSMTDSFDVGGHHHH